LAGGLIELGLKPMDRVALFLSASPEYLEAFYAVAYAGGTVVPINYQWKALELHRSLKDSRARSLIFSAEKAGEIRSLDRAELMLEKIIMVKGKPEQGWLDYSRLFSGRTFSPVEQAEDQPVGIIYTSGTTGRPKGVMLSHKNYLANLSQLNAILDLRETDRFLGILPLFHVLGLTVLVLAPVYTGASLVLLSEFSPRKVLTALRDFQITIFAGVPTVYSLLNNLPGDRLPELAGLRYALCGGAPLPPETLEGFERKYRTELLEGYGLSEATCACTLNPPDGKRKPGSVGPALPSQKIRVIGEAGSDLKPGEVGELWVSGDNVMLGYFENPAETAKVLQDGWLKTGDLGYCDPQGYFYIKGRQKEMIIRGGENIYPREIEETLLSHPGVLEAAVLGIPDRVWGEEVMAVIVPKGNPGVKTNILEEFCRERMADYKCPKLWQVLPEMPKSPTGEILKQQLLEKYRPGLK
jgi:long-chain acyl-CoA synthetase